MKELQRRQDHDMNDNNVDSIKIDCPDVSFLEFASDCAKKKDLFIAGYNTAINFSAIKEKMEMKDDDEKDGWNDEWDKW